MKSRSACANSIMARLKTFHITVARGHEALEQLCSLKAQSVVRQPASASRAARSAQRVRAAGLPCPVPAAGSLPTDAELPSHFGLGTPATCEIAKSDSYCCSTNIEGICHGSLQTSMELSSLAKSCRQRQEGSDGRLAPASTHRGMSPVPAPALTASVAIATYAVNPPSMVRLAPVTKLASGLAR